MKNGSKRWRTVTRAIEEVKSIPPCDAIKCWRCATDISEMRAIRHRSGDLGWYIDCTIVLPTCPEIRCPAWRWCKAASLQLGFRTELRWKSPTSEMSHTSTTPAGFFSPNMNPASSSQALSSSFVVCWLTTSRVPELGVSRTVGMHRRCIGDAGF